MICSDGSGLPGSPLARCGLALASAECRGKPVELRSGSRADGFPALLDGGGATHFLVYLADGRAALLDADATGITATVRRSVDRTRPLVDLDLAETPAVEVLEASNAPLQVAARVRDAGRVMLAADMLGAAQAMLDRAVAYAKERVQFGRVIGSFQGVKYMCADMATMLEPCRAMVWYAAYAQDAIPEEAAIAANHAKAHLAAEAIKARDSLRGPAQILGSGMATGQSLDDIQSWPERIAAVSADDVLVVSTTTAPVVVELLLTWTMDVGAAVPTPR